MNWGENAPKPICPPDKTPPGQNAVETKGCQ